MIKTIADLRAASATEIQDILAKIDLRGTVLRQIRRDAKRVTPSLAEYNVLKAQVRSQHCPTCAGTGEVTPKLRSVGGIHPSGAHKCRTRQYFDVVADVSTTEELDPDLFITFEIGHAVHAIVQKVLHRALGPKFHDEVLVQLDEALVDGGSADGEWNEDDWRMVIELKTMGAQFLKLGSPKPEHKLQATIYAKARDAPFIGFLYIHKENSEMKQFILPYDDRIYQDWLVEKVRPIEKGLETGVPPVADATSYECAQCPYGGSCEQKVGKKDAFQGRR